MKIPRISTTAAILILGGQVQAGPIDVVARQSGWAIVPDLVNLLGKFLGFAEGFFPPAPTLWDFNKHPQMCSVKMETHNGGNCKATVECNDGLREYSPAGEGWNVCFVGGRQYFNDPRIGDFSITFAEKDGRGQGEGLTSPILQVKYIENWIEIPVNGLASMYERHQDCSKTGGLGGSPFRDCGDGPFVCQYGDMGNMGITGSKTKKWECGIPKIGKGGGDLNSNGPENDRGFAPGWCGLHVVQFQKPDPSKDSYSLEITAVNDNNENKIGSNAKGGPTASVTSKLPWTIEVKTGGVDADPVSFAYGADSWNSNDGARCSVGKYDSGKREIDCGFTC